jgi:hypothetical protein
VAKQVITTTQYTDDLTGEKADAPSHSAGITSASRTTSAPTHGGPTRRLERRSIATPSRNLPGLRQRNRLRSRFSKRLTLRRNWSTREPVVAAMMRVRAFARRAADHSASTTCPVGR